MITSFKNRKINPKKPVKIYRCLNRSGVVYSIQQNGLVVAHGNEFNLINAKFLVSEAGRLATVKSQVKRVHAFVKGYICINPKNKHNVKVSYNPYKFPLFYVSNGKELTFVKETKEVAFTYKGVFIQR